MRNQRRHEKDEPHSLLEKYTSHFIWKGCVWEGVGDRTELQHIDPYSYGHSCFFPVLLGCSTGDPEAQLCWVLFSLQYHFSNSSDPQTPQSGVLRPLLPGAGFRYRFLSPTLLSPKTLNFLCTELYNSSTPTQYLPITGHRNMHFHRVWNGMFDRRRAEITVMQFTGHSLPVHQFVIVPWDFNPVPYCQPRSPTPMEYATSASLEWHVWPGRRSIYYPGKFSFSFFSWHI